MGQIFSGESQSAAGGAIGGATQGAQLGMTFGPWGAAIGGIAGGAMGAMGGKQAGKEAQALTDYNKAVLENQAKEIEAKTAFDQTRQAEEGSRTMSSMEAGQAAAGGGGNLLALAKQQSELTLQNLMIGREGTMAAQGIRQGIAMEDYKRKLAKRDERNRTIGLGIKAGATLLSGFSKSNSKVTGQAIGGADPSYVASKDFEKLSGQYGTFM